MRTPLYVFCFLALWACTNENDNEAVLPADPPKKYDSLISRFRKVSLDTLKVYSSDKGEFSGVSLDSSLAHHLDQAMGPPFDRDNSAFFAIYRFTIDDEQMGLLSRTPSIYTSSSVDLFILNRKKDSLYHLGQLGESWGDAGDEVAVESWLFHEGKNLQALKHVEVSKDNSVDNPEDTTYTVNHRYYLLRFGSGLRDTVSKDSIFIKNRFPNLLK